MHYGWGYCHLHERKVGPEESKRMEDSMLAALRGRHPNVYKDVGKFAGMVEREGQEAAEKLGLIDEIRIARGAVQEMILHAQGDHQLQEYVSNGGEMGMVLKPMSDKTRLQILGKMLPTVAKLAQAADELRNKDTISDDQFKVWFGRLWAKLKRIGEDVERGELKTSVAVEQAMMNVFRDVGDPRTIKL